MEGERTSAWRLMTVYSPPPLSFLSANLCLIVLNLSLTYRLMWNIVLYSASDKCSQFISKLFV